MEIISKVFDLGESKERDAMPALFFCFIFFLACDGEMVSLELSFFIFSIFWVRVNIFFFMAKLGGKRTSFLWKSKFGDFDPMH